MLRSNTRTLAWQGKRFLPSKAVEKTWITHNKNGAYVARGVHGQTIYIDPKAEMVIVRFASHPIAGNSANDPTSLPAYAAVADYLIRKK